MRPQRTSSGQRKGSCRATNLGTFREWCADDTTIPTSRQASASARQQSRSPASRRNLLSASAASAPCREAWRDVAAVFRPAVRASPQASVPALTPAEAGSAVHRQVSSKVRPSMLCSPPFSRHTCPRAARCAGKPGGRFLVVGHLSAHRAKAAPLSSIKICCEADYANSQTQPFA